MTSTRPTSTTLHTDIPHLVLRDLTSADAAALYALLRRNRDHLTAHGDYREQVDASLPTLAAELADNAKQRFGIFLEGELIGRTDLIPVDPPRYSMGYWLARSATGKGYATAAVIALTRYAFAERGATDIYAGVTHGNGTSERLLYRLGFVPAATFQTYTRFRLTRPS